MVKVRFFNSYFFLLSLFLTINVCPGQVDEGLSIVNSYIRSAKATFNVPGLSIAIVKDRKPYLVEGYGISGVVDSSAMDACTLFPMASTTKALTAVAMSILEDRGLVQWNSRVKDILPDFELSDPYVTSEITVKDLFTHNTGLTNTDLLWTLWDYSQEEIVERLDRASLDYSLRDGYRYQNVMYMIAGLVIEKISGLSWGEFIKKEVLQPLNMSSTCPTKDCAYQINNRSRPHAAHIKSGALIEILDSEVDTIDAAGSAWTNGDDAALWLQFMLDSCKVNGRRIISESNYNLITSPHRWISQAQFYSSAELTQPNFMAYGMGWYMHDYKGKKILFHTGSLNGAKAIAGLIPEENIGVYVFSNKENCEVRHALMYYLMDMLLGDAPRSWVAEINDIYDQSYKRRSAYRDQLEQERELNTSTTHELAMYTGTYSNEFLGELQITQINDQLRITTRSNRHLILDHWHWDTFYAAVEEYQEYEYGRLVDFDINPDGTPELDLYGYVFEKKK